MFLDKKPFIFLWKPLYWLVFEMIIHPILRRVWNYLLTLPLPASPAGDSMGARLRQVERMGETLDRVESTLAGLRREHTDSALARATNESAVLVRLDATLAELQHTQAELRRGHEQWQRTQAELERTQAEWQREWLATEKLLLALMQETSSRGGTVPADAPASNPNLTNTSTPQ